MDFKLLIVPSAFDDLTVNTPSGSVSGATVPAVAAGLTTAGYLVETSSSTDGGLSLVSISGETVSSGAAFDYVLTKSGVAGASTPALSYTHSENQQTSGDPAAGAMTAAALLLAFVASR